MRINVNQPIQRIVVLTLFFILASCARESKSDQNIETAATIPKTILIKEKHALTKSYEVGIISKSYSYYWLAGNDTLDIKIGAREYSSDSTLHLYVRHKKPVLFSTIIERINECFPKIREDFYLDKLQSIYFREPIYYSDLVVQLSTEYEQQFGYKNIRSEKLNPFLLNSTLNSQLEGLVSPLGKKVKRYSIEKFHLMEKKYFNSYLPNVDLAGYPEFALHGMGLGVQFEPEGKINYVADTIESDK